MNIRVTPLNFICRRTIPSGKGDLRNRKEVPVLLEDFKYSKWWMSVLFLYFRSLVGWQFPQFLLPGIWRAHARRELHSTKRYWVSEKIHHHESKKTGRKSPINVLCYLLEHKHFLRCCIRELKYIIPARSEAKNLKSKRKRLRYRIIQFI